MDTKNKSLGSCLIAFLLLTAADQFTKYLAVTYLAGKKEISLIPGVFELFYLENRGAAFGMFAGRQWFFIAVALAMLVIAFLVCRKLPASRHFGLLRLVCVLIAAGAAGNMLDRLFRRYVVDFLYFSLIDFPVFNVADCYVCAGAALAVIGIFTVYREDNFDFLLPGKRAGEE